MSTDLVDNRPESTEPVAGDGQVVPQYRNPTAPGYVPPPEGMRYMRDPTAKGMNIIGQDGKPILQPKKKSKGRKKGKKPTWLVPDGGIVFPTPIPADFNVATVMVGYDVDKHAKCKPSDFPDPLHAAMFEQWYFEQKVATAKNDVARLLELGSTVEERKAAQEENKALKAMEELLSKKGGKSAKLLERLGKLFAEASSK